MTLRRPGARVGSARPGTTAPRTAGSRSPGGPAPPHAGAPPPPGSCGVVHMYVERAPVRARGAPHQE
eukprot:15286167-Alexandrium_andersonii.AAC.1